MSMRWVIAALASVAFAVSAEIGCSVSGSTLNCRGRGETVYVCQADLWSPGASLMGGCTQSFRKPFCAKSEAGADYLFSTALRTFVANVISDTKGWNIVTACVDTKKRSYTSDKAPPRPSAAPTPVPPSYHTEGLGGGSFGTGSGVGGGFTGPAATVGAGGGGIQDSTGSGFEPVGTCMLPDVSGAGGGLSAASGFGGAVSIDPGVGGGI